MTRTAGVGLATMLALGLLAGCGGSSSGSSGGSSSTSGTTTPGPIGGGGGAPPPAPTPTPAPPPSGTGSGGTGGVAGEFQRTFQARDYQLYVPDSYVPSQPLPLVVCFHGAGDTAANFWNALRAGGWLDAARSEGVILVAPDTKSPLGSFPVWSGNPTNDIPQMQTELGEVLDLLDQDVLTRYNVETQSLHALGFSDGGLFTAAVGLGHPRLATASIFGYGWGGQHITPPSHVAPVHMACGSSDSFFSFAQQSQAFLGAQGHDLLWEPVGGVGHSFVGVSLAVGAVESLRWLQARPLGGTQGGGSTGGGSPGGGSSGASGSGGSGGALGLSTRTIQTPAQAGLPSVSIDYQVYVPAGYDPQTPAPLVVAANMGLAPWQALAGAETLIVIDFRDHDRDGGYTYQYDVLGLNEILGDVEGAYNVDTRRRYYHGFSAGGHWGLATVLANANTFAAIGVNAGSLGAAIQTGVWPGLVQRPIPVAIRQGLNDQVVPVANARQSRDLLMQAGHPVDYQEFAGGHTISAADAAGVWAFLQQHQAP